MNRLSIIVPTIGRATLRRTLNSIAPQLREGDECLVVADGHLENVEALCREFGEAFHYLTWRDERSVVGQAQRNAGILAARGDYLAFIGDDDVYTPDAFDAIREAIRAACECDECGGSGHTTPWAGEDAENCDECGGKGWHSFKQPFFLFRVNTWSSGLVWSLSSNPHDRLKIGNIDASCAVFPNNGHLGVFTNRYEGDFDFIRESLWKNRGKGVWKEEVIVICRPERFERMVTR